MTMGSQRNEGPEMNDVSGVAFFFGVFFFDCF